ncbi:AAA family ATPase [Zobellella taiwanensis]
MKKYELLNLLKKEQLQVILRYHKQYISGNKGDLIDRVLEHVDLHGALNTLGYQEIKDLCHYFNIKYNLKDKAIDDILTALHNTSKDTQKEKYSDNEFELAMDELNSLTGLYEVKRKINQLIGYIKVQDERKMRGLEYVTVGKHLVFTGNPGTGKTTVARIIGRLYKSMGVVSNGHFREVTRADLVGKYIGHSEEITQKILNEAKGGILFINEAYSLSNGLDSDFGRVVIETLLTALENYRDDMAIIVAGYKKEMDLFLQSNPIQA